MANKPKMTSIIHTLYDDVFTKGDLKKLDAIISSKLKIHDPALHKQFQGLQGFREAESLYHKAFPGKRATIEQLFVTDDCAIVHWRCKGVHKGSFNGLQATNLPFEITGLTVYKFSGDQITEIWQNWDRMGFYEQIGELEKTHALSA